MYFLHPEYSLAFLILIIPIIIHLFNFRRYKNIIFSNISFIQELSKHTKEKSQLKKYLILGCRLLAFVFLVLALMQPSFYEKKQDKNLTSNNIYGIYIDNSFSMLQENDKGSLLDNAKQIALNIANKSDLNNSFILITNDNNPEYHSILNKNDFIRLLNEVEISSKRKTFNEIILQQKELSSNIISNNHLILISDFQKNFIDKTKFNTDSSTRITVIPISSQEIKNVYIDSIWFESPFHQKNKSEKLFVKLKNIGTEDIQQASIKIFINGEIKSSGSYSVKKNNSFIDTLFFTNYESGWQNGHIQIQDSPINFDDDYFFSYNIQENRNVLIINEDNPNKYLTEVFSIDKDFFNLQNVSKDKIDYEAINNQDLIILNNLKFITSGLSQKITNFVSNGGNVCILTRYDADIDSYNSLLGQLNTDLLTNNIIKFKYTADKINLNSEFFYDIFENTPSKIDLPYTNLFHEIKKSVNSSKENLIDIPFNNNYLLSSFNYQNGKVYFSPSALVDTTSNLTKHALFLPIMYQMAILKSNDYKLSYTIDNDDIKIKKNNDKPLFFITGQDFKISLDLDVNQNSNFYSAKLNNQITKPGHYYLLNQDKQIATLAFNSNKDESILEYYNNDELELLLLKKGISLKHSSTNNNILDIEENSFKLWKISIILCLIFLTLEILILRFFNYNKYGHQN